LINTAEIRPRLACSVEWDGDSVVLARDGVEFALEPGSSTAAELKSFLARFDGKQSVAEIGRHLGVEERARLKSVIQELDRMSLLDDTGRRRVRTGSQALAELEDVINEQKEDTLNRNIFWERVLGDRKECPRSVLYGLAIENYHFLVRETSFDSPVLPCLANKGVRALMNEFYCSEHRHDILVLRALNAIGVSSDELDDGMPLAETLALCNALTLWATTDPLFFFLTLGFLEGGDSDTDSYLDACERHKLPSGFVVPMRQHSDINAKAEHGNLTRTIFAEIPYVDDETMDRMRRQIRLFMEMYDDFHTAVWEYYSTSPVLVRRVSSI
jgi:hypothetical protein